MDDLIFHSIPNNSIKIRVSSQIIKRYYTNSLANTKYIFEEDNKGEYTFNFVLQIKLCLFGEIYLKQILM